MSDEAHGEVEGPIDVLYVDGAHRYAPARADIEQWGARVAPGGTLLVHDSYNADRRDARPVARAVLLGEWRYVGRRARWPSTAARTLGRRARRNALRQAARMPYFVRNA